MSSEIIAILPILFFSVIIHECAHGFVASLFGDDTASRAGRLTLNPIPHIDLFGTIILPMILLLSGSRFWIGWAKPVPINPRNFKNYELGLFTVSLAGIVANFLAAVFFTAIIFIAAHVHVSSIVLNFLVYGVYINVMLAVFNLIPIPPLDGSKLLYAVLPKDGRVLMDKFSLVGFILILILINVSYFRLIFVGVISGIVNFLLSFV